MINITKKIIDKALQVDIIDLVKSKGIKLRKSGKEYKSRCPFPEHRDTSPSFYVNPVKKLYHCFGCGKSGNAINFLVELDKLTFIEAVEQLFKTQGLTFKKEPEQPAKTNDLLNRVAGFYHRAFMSSPKALNYLAEERKIKGQDIYNTFKIGYADGSILKVITGKSKLRAELKKTGLITRYGREFFNGCIVFPILDENNNCVSMYGRRIKSNNGKPKHLYLPGQHKGVFNRLAVKRSKEIVLTESIIDALSGISNGYTEIIPVYGTNGLTEHHIDLFKESCIKKITFAFDNDKPGRDAVNKVVDRLKNLPVSFNRITLPESMDLNDYFKTGRNGDFKDLIKNAEPLNITAKPADTYELKLNGDEINFKSNDINYTVRGLNLYGFSRMKVNVRARHGAEFHIDTIDLYANRPRTSFINQCAKRFEIEYSRIERDIFNLIRELEKIRDEHIKAQQEKEKFKIPELTETGKKAAVKFLMRKDLIKEIINDLTILGYVGEETNKVIGYLVSLSRKLYDPLACIILSRSSGGKSFLIEVIEQLTPPENLIAFSDLTPQALYYMEQDELAHKLLTIEERKGSEQADYSIRQLQSKKVLRKGVPLKDPSTGKIRTVHLEVHGPIAYMESTTNHNINPENANRCFILHIDESPKQTRRIHEMQKKLKTLEGLKLKQQIYSVMEKHHNAQRLLKSVHVFNPFSELIDFPADRLRTRRDHYRFLNLIEAITFLHQYQRGIKEYIDKSTGEIIEYVESTIDDYRIAYNLIKKILNVTLDELSKNSRDLLSMIQEYVKKKAKKLKQSKDEVTFTRREIREFTKWSNDQIKNHIKQLEEMEYLTFEKGMRGQRFTYKLMDEAVKIEDITRIIPTPTELKKKLKTRKRTRKKVV